MRIPMSSPDLSDADVAAVNQVMEDGKRKGENVGRKMRRRKWVGCEAWKFGGERWGPEEVRVRKPIQSCRDLDVFHLAYTLAMEVFHLTARFPKEERYALVDQMRRLS